MGVLDVIDSWPEEPSAAVVLLGVEPAAAFPASVAETYGDPDRLFPFASITKLITALSVLVAVEEGIVDLDMPAGPPGSTVRHLLAHASGMAPDGNLVLEPPGSRRIYSNRGYEILASSLAGQATMEFDRYLKEAVLDPLGMSHTSLEPEASAASGAKGSVSDLVQLVSELQSPSIVDI